MRRFSPQGIRYRKGVNLQKMESSSTTKVRSGFFSRVLLLVWLISLGFVCYLSLIPKVEFPVDFSGADLLYHSLAYFWLAFLPSFVFRSGRQAISRLLLVIVFGVVLEFGQLFVPGRYFSIADMGANNLGAILGSLCGTRTRSILLRRDSRERG